MEWSVEKGTIINNLLLLINGVEGRGVQKDEYNVIIYSHDTMYRYIGILDVCIVVE